MASTATEQIHRDGSKYRDWLRMRLQQKYAFVTRLAVRLGAAKEKGKKKEEKERKRGTESGEKQNEDAKV